MRTPTLHLDEEYEKQLEELVSYAIALSEEVQTRASAGT